MIRRLIKKFLPHPDVITNNRWIKRLGPRLQEPSLWHLNRRSFAGAIALGIFCAFIPVPFQMLLAAFGAIIFRVNILVAVPTVWLSNPLTMPPMFYFCYLVGVEILNTEVGNFAFELSFDWLLTGLQDIWQPFLLGCLVVGSTLSIMSYITIRLFWRYHILSQMKLRKNRDSNGK